MALTLTLPVRLGAVSYLNTLPLIEGLGKLSDLSLTLTAPSRLIDLLTEGTVDLALASVIDAQRSIEPLAILPVGMIGSDDSTLTVRLFSRVPIDRLERVHADIDSHTSIAMLRVLLGERHGISPTMIPYDAEHPSDSPEAVLLIGDKVITHAPSRRTYPVQLDLGEAWRALTGGGFVYAAWMCRARDAERAEIELAARVLDRQRRHNATRIPWIAAARAPAREWPVDLARDYLGRHLRYDVSTSDRAAVEKFFALCVKHRVLPALKPVSWLEHIGSTLACKEG